jgi:hypothetical protein
MFFIVQMDSMALFIRLIIRTFQLVFSAGTGFSLSEQLYLGAEAMLGDVPDAYSVDVDW